MAGETEILDDLTDVDQLASINTRTVMLITIVTLLLVILMLSLCLCRAKEVQNTLSKATKQDHMALTQTTQPTLKEGEILDSEQSYIGG